MKSLFLVLAFFALTLTLIPHCQQYTDSSRNSCLVCELSFYPEVTDPQQNLRTCSKCHYSCLACLGKGKKQCSACPEGRYYRESMCLMCEEGCEKCSELNECEKCNEGYNLKSGVCLEKRKDRTKFLVIIGVILGLVISVAIYWVRKIYLKKNKRRTMARNAPLIED